MLTYNDLLDTGNDEKERMNFVLQAINEHENSDIYKEAVEYEMYAQGHNALIEKYQKFLYTISGEIIPDNYSADHKCKSGFFKRIVTQRAAYLLGNGISYKEKPNDKNKLGINIDSGLYFAGKTALIQGVVFGFFNNGSVEFFKLAGGKSEANFKPLYDDEDGSLKAGIRYWRISSNKPLRATLYEIDGYTDYIKINDEDMQILHDKRSYKQIREVSEIEEKIYNYDNYDSFPIVPYWGNREKQSAIVGLKEQIDCYDLIKSGFANDLDEASMFYWTLENCGGMDDTDLVKFVERMKTMRAAVLDGEKGATATAHTLDIPYQSREVYLERLKKDIEQDAMILNTEQIAAGNVTATQINAAYEPLNEITDEFEFCTIDFLTAIGKFAGIEEVPKFKRSQLKNQLEETQMIIAAAAYLDGDTILEKLPFLTVDEVQSIKERSIAEDIEKMSEQSPPVS